MQLGEDAQMAGLSHIAVLDSVTYASVANRGEVHFEMWHTHIWMFKRTNTKIIIYLRLIRRTLATVSSGNTEY